MAVLPFPTKETRAAGTNCDAIRVSTTSMKMDVNYDFLQEELSKIN